MESVVDGNGVGSRRVMTELSHIKELVKQLDVHGAPGGLSRPQAPVRADRHRHREVHRHHYVRALPRPETLCRRRRHRLASPLGGGSKKRKMMEKGERRVRLSSEDDRFSWRKYGQKEILGALNPRGYYRCTHQKTQGCPATKQVQRADEDPTLFDVTYHGTHTCGNETAAAANAEPAAATPNPDASSFLKSLSSSLTVNTEGLTSGPQQDWRRTTPFSFSPAVSGLLTPGNCFGHEVSLSSSRLELSPATSDSSYNPMNPFEEEWSGQSELVSALVTAMSTHQPAVEVEEAAFSLDLDGLELFDNPIFDVSILDYLPCLGY